MRRSLTRGQRRPGDRGATFGEACSGPAADACPLRDHMGCWDKRKEASHCAWSTEGYYVIGK